MRNNLLSTIFLLINATTGTGRGSDLWLVSARARPQTKFFSLSIHWPTWVCLNMWQPPAVVVRCVLWRGLSTCRLVYISNPHFLLDAFTWYARVLVELGPNTFSGQKPLSSWKSATDPHKTVLTEHFWAAESISFCWITNCPTPQKLRQQICNYCPIVQMGNLGWTHLDSRLDPE